MFYLQPENVFPNTKVVFPVGTGNMPRKASLFRVRVTLLVMLSHDSCRSKHYIAMTSDALARRLSIQMRSGTLSLCSRSTPVDPNADL